MESGNMETLSASSWSPAYNPAREPQYEGHNGCPFPAAAEHLAPSSEASKAPLDIERVCRRTAWPTCHSEDPWEHNDTAISYCHLGGLSYDGIPLIDGNSEYPVNAYHPSSDWSTACRSSRLVRGPVLFSSPHCCVSPPWYPSDRWQLPVPGIAYTPGLTCDMEGQRYLSSASCMANQMHPRCPECPSQATPMYPQYASRGLHTNNVRDPYSVTGTCPSSCCCSHITHLPLPSFAGMPGFNMNQNFHCEGNLQQGWAFASGRAEPSLQRRPYAEKHTMFVPQRTENYENVAFYNDKYSSLHASQASQQEKFLQHGELQQQMVCTPSKSALRRENASGYNKEVRAADMLDCENTFDTQEPVVSACKTPRGGSATIPTKINETDYIRPERRRTKTLPKMKTGYSQGFFLTNTQLSSEGSSQRHILPHSDGQGYFLTENHSAPQPIQRLDALDAEGSTLSAGQCRSSSGAGYLKTSSTPRRDPRTETDASFIQQLQEQLSEPFSSTTSSAPLSLPKSTPSFKTKHDQWPAATERSRFKPALSNSVGWGSCNSKRRELKTSQDHSAIKLDNTRSTPRSLDTPDGILCCLPKRPIRGGASISRQEDSFPPREFLRNRMKQPEAVGGLRGPQARNNGSSSDSRHGTQFVPPDETSRTGEVFGICAKNAASTSQCRKLRPGMPPSVQGPAYPHSCTHALAVNQNSQCENITAIESSKGTVGSSASASSFEQTSFLPETDQSSTRAFLNPHASYLQTFRVTTSSSVESAGLRGRSTSGHSSQKSYVHRSTTSTQSSERKPKHGGHLHNTFETSPPTEVQKMNGEPKPWEKTLRSPASLSMTRVPRSASRVASMKRKHHRTRSNNPSSQQTATRGAPISNTFAVTRLRTETLENRNLSPCQKERAETISPNLQIETTGSTASLNTIDTASSLLSKNSKLSQKSSGAFDAPFQPDPQIRQLNNPQESSFDRPLKEESPQRVRLPTFPEAPQVERLSSSRSPRQKPSDKNDLPSPSAFLRTSSLPHLSKVSGINHAELTSCGFECVVADPTSTQSSTSSISSPSLSELIPGKASSSCNEELIKNQLDTPTGIGGWLARTVRSISFSRKTSTLTNKENNCFSPPTPDPHVAPMDPANFNSSTVETLDFYDSPPLICTSRVTPNAYCSLLNNARRAGKYEVIPLGPFREEIAKKAAQTAAGTGRFGPLPWAPKPLSPETAKLQ